MDDGDADWVYGRKLRAGVRLSAVSIVWTLLSSTSSIAIGASSHSLVLVAFGMTGLLDAAGSAALVLHFRHALTHEQISEKHERIAFLIVNTGLIVVAVFTGTESAHRLIVGSHSESTTIGVAIAAMSAVVLMTLAVRKRSVGAAIPSAALRADGALSATGSLLAVVTVAGAALTNARVYWADPAAAALVAVCALSIGVVLRVKN